MLKIVTDASNTIQLLNQIQSRKLEKSISHSGVDLLAPQGLLYEFG